MLEYGRKWSITEAHNRELTRLLDEHGIDQVGDSGIYAYRNNRENYYWIGDNGGELYVEKVNDSELRADIAYKFDIGYPSPEGLLVGIIKALNAMEEGRTMGVKEELEWIAWMREYGEIGFTHFDFPEHGT